MRVPKTAETLATRVMALVESSPRFSVQRTFGRILHAPTVRPPALLRRLKVHRKFTTEDKGTRANPVMRPISKKFNLSIKWGMGQTSHASEARITTKPRASSV